MPENILYTMGHSNHSHEESLKLLREHAVTAVADVRSSPYSQFMPEYNMPVIEAVLRKAAVSYVHLGRELGVRRDSGGARLQGCGLAGSG